MSLTRPSSCGVSSTVRQWVTLIEIARNQGGGEDRQERDAPPRDGLGGRVIIYSLGAHYDISGKEGPFFRLINSHQPTMSGFKARQVTSAISLAIWAAARPGASTKTFRFSGSRFRRTTGTIPTSPRTSACPGDCYELFMQILSSSNPIN